MPVTDFLIDYVSQRIYHDPGVADPEVVPLGDLYTHFTDVFDNDVQMDDLPPMSAQTPTAFTMENGWFIDPVSLQFLNGGSLATLGWNHNATYPNGIRILEFAAGGYAAAAADVGKKVVYADATPTDSGILLYADDVARKWWVRADNVGSTFQTIEALDIPTGTGGGTLSVAATTGENTWANIFTLGTLAANTQICLYQSDAQITPWWSTGHIDILTLVKEAGELIDSGNVTIYVRQYTKLYDHYVADLSTGARTPIPLATFDDSNNLSGYQQMVFADASDNFTVGEIIEDQTDKTIQGIVTSSIGTAPDITVQYYLFNSTQGNFSSTGGHNVLGLTSGENATAVNPTDVGPLNLPEADPVITFGGGDNYDLNNTDGPQQYDVVIDCNQNSLADVYEYLKYITRYGNTATLTGSGHPGEAYTGVGDIRLNYSNLQNGTFTVGNTVTGSSSAATGVIVAVHSANPAAALTIRDVTGTWTAADVIQDGSVTADVDSVETISPSKQAPFGTFAGGKFFGARGVWLTDYKTSEANNFQLIDSTNTPRIPPSSITLTVNGLLTGDQVAVFKATGDNNTVDKRMYSIYADQPAGLGYIDITGAAPNDTPGQTSGGYIRVVRYDGPTAAALIVGEEKYTYTGWVNNTTYTRFTLDPGSAVPTTTEAYTTANDKVYVPYIDENSLTETTVTVGLIYTSDRYITARVRKSGYLPFMIKSAIANSNLTITAVRATDPNAI